MKKLFFPICFLVAMVSQSNAQVDVQINPLALLFGSIDLTAEFPVSQDFGIEGGLDYNFQSFDIDDIEYKNNGVGIRAVGKYYFNPNRGIDRWNIGAYMKFVTGTSSAEDATTADRDEVKNTRFAVGFYTGYKWVSRKNIIFELGLGLGRNFVSNHEYSDGTEVDDDDVPLLNVDILGRLSVGYRFGGGAKK
jgi:hypothetical protein